MKDLISHIVRALVDHPEEVAVSEIEGGQTVILELRVAKSDRARSLANEHGVVLRRSERSWLNGWALWRIPPE